ncbi:hypothetical protein [Ancylobacter mangrovi]|uniref:hypothetical protein n=1 Tax=Ancylobacter mangrovi TaxID=2972472 RepID=UPI0021613BDB|nr:hypothetical protein [Ancylobacter mangrovi]MCS0502619.1 hypothetical protein [Ancylobacter mangrovi]
MGHAMLEMCALTGRPLLVGADAAMAFAAPHAFGTMTQCVLYADAKPRTGLPDLGNIHFLVGHPVRLLE